MSPIEFSFDILNMVDWENGKPYMDILETTMEVPRHLLSNQKVEHIEFMKTCDSHLGSRSKKKAGHKQHPSQPAGVTGTCSGQLVVETSRSSGQMARDTSINIHHHMDNSEIINSNLDENKLLYKLPKSLVEDDAKMQELLKSSKVRCNSEQKPSSKPQPST